MPAKSVFTPEQKKTLRAALGRLLTRFSQKELETKLRIKQQSISDLKGGKYAPSQSTAILIAKLDGHPNLESLVGEVGAVDLSKSPPAGFEAVKLRAKAFPNLELCVGWFSNKGKTWSPWTIGAAREGFFGLADFPADDWEEKLDFLEKALERARKAS